MVTYGDYFSRKTLHYCGVSPDTKLFENEGTTYAGMQRMEKLRSEMSDIYQTLYRGHTKNGAGQSNVNFADFQVERKIVAAFYDAGVLNNAERDYFQTQSLQSLNEREKISVEEADVLLDTAKSQSVSAPMKTPLSRNMRQ